ncbi:hypothetical protein CHLRE_10g452100v5 [Chlamydomonas reinhardtii]|uniref:Uncharacterized protein n=1 Tax=Chlamydomonas reinhardtii TaxID=3055 RepID=A0A2K3DB84_CHLRE|nr:uncharacterized protein CHLRE_10g452100v5 [Chlamydomonas reinhardtii]PNW77795.1 hypothetical protein CHLRE_10g452100v5 [Chlamydomonas reinhardtii]
MAALRMSAPTSAALRSSVRSAKPVLPVRRAVRSVVVRAQASEEQLGFKVGTVATLSSVAASWMMAGNAQAATELASLAASDNRAGILATLLVPVLGWVGFNIFGSLQAQLNQMDAKNKRAVPAAVGMGAAASLLFAQSAEASTEIATLAASDNRVAILATLLVPVIGWVGFNIFGSLQAQLNQMDAKNKRAVPAAVGMGAAASLLFAQSAEASTEIATLAASDNRVAILATLLVPVIGWVGFNIFGSLQAQLNQMDAKNKRAVPAAVGMGAAASLLFAQSAEASTEIATLAASDNRVAILATLLVPVIGWVGFNIFGSLQAQLNQMDAKNKRAVPAAVGMGAAASLLFAQSAEASTEIATLAASDNRVAILATLLVPVIGWVGFNIFGSLQAQLRQMDAKNK